MVDLVYTVSDNNIHIEDSYKVSKKEFDFDLNEIRELYPDNAVLVNRSNKSLKREWALHNLLYDLHILRSHTKDVDLNYPQKWYISLVYTVFGSIALLLIP